MPNDILQHDDEANDVRPLGQPTAGPWEVQNGIIVVSTALKGKLHFTDAHGVEHYAEKGLIALVYACHPDGEYHSGTSNANASLIAAAPDLLAACEAVMESAGPAGWANDSALSAIATAVLGTVRAAIAKAEGRS